MGKVYAILMNKGGVGKSTIISNLASLAALDGKRVLIIDTDGQGNSSLAFGIIPSQIQNTVSDICTGRLDFDDIIYNVDQARMELGGLDPTNLALDLAAANSDMNMLDFEILTKLDQYPNPFRLLVDPLQKVRDRYDAIFIDSPPAMGLVAGNVLSVADEIIIPFIPESFGVQGFIRVIEALDDFEEAQGIRVDIAGVVGTMFDARTTLHHDMVDDAKTYCSQNNIRFFETLIPKSIQFAKTFAYQRLPAVLVDRYNYIVAHYEALYTELMRK